MFLLLKTYSQRGRGKDQEHGYQGFSGTFCHGGKMTRRGTEDKRMSREILASLGTYSKGGRGSGQGEAGGQEENE